MTTIYNDMDTHLSKLKLCFFKCREYGISLDLEKCIHGILKNDLGIHSFQGREITGSHRDIGISEHVC
jgi:hypothetical protein